MNSVRKSVLVTARHLLQFGQTQRYHTEVMIKPQDVAQHSFNVAWLCWLLSDKDPSASLLMAALAHDAGERKTGDVPAPTKRRNNDFHDILDMMEVEYVGSVGYKQEPLSLIERQILKVSDMLEGAFFCLRELKMGNRLVVDPDSGGAGINWLAYIEDWVQKADIQIQAPQVNIMVWDLLTYLKEQYAACQPHTHPADPYHAGWRR